MKKVVGADLRHRRYSSNHRPGNLGASACTFTKRLRTADYRAGISAPIVPSVAFGGVSIRMRLDPPTFLRGTRRVSVPGSDLRVAGGNPGSFKAPAHRHCTFTDKGIL